MGTQQPAGGEMYRAGPPALSPRLAAAVALVRPGVPVADIGCDHGKLAVHLALCGISPRVIAADIRPMPLAKAKALVKQTGCGDIVDCRLGDGLAVLQPGEVQDIIIAGMSGETMCGILGAAPQLFSVGLRLVLVPTTRQPMLRQWLLQNGFALLEELAVQDAGRAYTVISAGYTGKAEVQAPLFYELGALAGDTSPAAVQYKQSRLQYLKSRRLAPLNPEESDALERLISEVQACLE